MSRIFSRIARPPNLPSLAALLAVYFLAYTWPFSHPPPPHRIKKKNMHLVFVGWLVKLYFTIKNFLKRENSQAKPNIILIFHKKKSNVSLVQVSHLIHFYAQLGLRVVSKFMRQRLWTTRQVSAECACRPVLRTLVRLSKFWECTLVCKVVRFIRGFWAYVCIWRGSDMPFGWWRYRRQGEMRGCDMSAYMLKTGDSGVSRWAMLYSTAGITCTLWFYI